MYNATEGPGGSTADGSSLSGTDWSMIFDAAGDDADRAASAMDRLARRYWTSFYAFFVSKGRDVHSAADLTQRFVCNVLLGRDLVKSADPNRGRFRSLLLAALKAFLKEEDRHRRAKKRQPASGPPVGLDPAELERAAVSRDQSPDAAFCAQWSATIVRRVLDTVRAGCLADGQEPHWIVFECRVVRPILTGEPAGEYGELVERLGLQDASQASNMMITVKRRFARELYAEVARTVNDPALVEEEVHELIRDLERTS